MIDPDSTQSTGVPAEYRGLYRYLENRFADTVVLTFAQIESLLGRALPDLARRRQEWWANRDASGAATAHASSWTQASRTATANLLAQNVVFERVPN